MPILLNHLADKLSPSLMCADSMFLHNCVETFEKEKINYLHIDVMDGHFVQNFSLGTDYIKTLHSQTRIPLDIHLMIEEPEKKIDWIDPRQGDLVSVHYESTPHIHRALQIIRDHGASPIVALNPGTPISVLEDIACDIDGVLIMTVNPGFAGQKLIPQTLHKIEKLRHWLDENNFGETQIEVDGNVSFENGVKMKRAGANIFVVGSSSVFTPEMALPAAIGKFRAMLGEA